MNSAGLNRQAIFERPVTIDGEFGPQPGGWAPVVSLPGSPTVGERWWVELQDVLPSRAEAVRMGLTVARNQTRLRMRWRGDIDSSMRVRVFGETETIYQIVAGPAEIEGRKARIEMMLERYSS